MISVPRPARTRSRQGQHHPYARVSSPRLPQAPSPPTGTVGVAVQGAQFRLWLNTVQLGAIRIVSTHTGREPQRRQFEKVR